MSDPVKPTDGSMVNGSIGVEGTAVAMKVSEYDFDLKARTKESTGDADTAPQFAVGMVDGDLTVGGYMLAGATGFALAALGVASPPPVVNVAYGPTGNFWIESIAFNARKGQPLMALKISGKFHGLPTAGTVEEEPSPVEPENVSCVNYAANITHNMIIQGISGVFFAPLQEDTGDGDAAISYAQSCLVYGQIKLEGLANGVAPIPGTQVDGAVITIGGITVGCSVIVEEVTGGTTKNGVVVPRTITLKCTKVAISSPD